MRSLIHLAAGALAGLGLGLGCAAGAAGQGTVICSANPCVIQSANATGADTLEVMGPHESAVPTHVLAVTDWQGIDMFDVNTGQVATGDLPLCVTDPKFVMVACLSPGTWDQAAGQYRGPPFLQLGGYRLTIPRLRWLIGHAG